VTKLPEIFVVVHFHKYYGSSKETLKIPWSQESISKLELERVYALE